MVVWSQNGINDRSRNRTIAILFNHKIAWRTMFGRATSRATVELLPVEQSEWAAPIVVIKKDEGMRVCADF